MSTFVPSGKDLIGMGSDRNLTLLFLSYLFGQKEQTPDPWKGRSGSNRGKRRIPLLGYEDELVPGGGPAIWSIQKEGTGIEILRQREYSHTRYSPRDPLRSLQPPRKTYLKEAVNPSGSGGIDLPGPRERSPQCGFSSLCFTNNRRIMRKTGWEAGEK